MKIKHLSLSMLIATTFVLISNPAQAIVEVRAGYGIHTPDENVGNNSESLGGITADIMVKPPMMGLGFGLRYEMQSKDSNSIDVEHTRASVQVAYTALDLTLFNLDLVGGVGLTENLDVGSNIKLDEGRTFNVGALGKVNLGLISLNAELGYLFGKLKNDLIEAEMNGVYTKFLVGIGF